MTQTSSSNKQKSKVLVQNSIMVAMALALSFMERLFPMALIVPLPGIKLGLANIVTMFALFFFGWQSAFLVTVVRCLLAAIFYGGVTSLALSLAGGLLALGTMSLLRGGVDRWVSLLGVSIAGAAAHNTGQVAMAAFLMDSTAVLAYLTVLLLTAIITGLITGALSELLFRKLQRTGLFSTVK